MKIDSIEEKINTYSGEYRQLLKTILYNINEREYKEFYNLIIEAENKSLKIEINEESLSGLWDSLTIKNLKLVE